MELVVVIGTSPAMDVSVAVGPFRSQVKAREAFVELEHKGYVAEICPLRKIDEIEVSEAWEATD